MEDKITIIIPCYNVERYIGRCLTSVVNQTIGIEQLEIICVNDASTDATWKELCQWEKRYPEHMILINCEENGAQGRARNIALSHATGRYITFLDSDDWIELDTYQRMYQAMKEYGCDMVQCGWSPDPGYGDIWEIHKKPPGKDYLLEIDSSQERKKLLATGLLGNMCVNTMYRADMIFDNHLYFLEKCKYEDVYWGLMTYFYGTRIYFISQAMYHYFINEGSTVLSRNASHHLDLLDVVMRWWQECKERGLLEEYGPELELNFLIHYYLGGMKMLSLRYAGDEYIPFKYKIFQRMCRTVQETIPQYMDNPYIGKILSETDQLQIALIGHKLSKDEFVQVLGLQQGRTGEDG